MAQGNCIGFPNYYWLNYKPIVYSEQIKFCHLVNENSVHWTLVDIPRKEELYSPQKYRTTCKVLKKLFSLTHREQRKFCGPAGRHSRLQELRRHLKPLAQVINVKTYLQRSVTDHWSQRSLPIHMHNAYTLFFIRLQVISFHYNVIN